MLEPKPKTIIVVHNEDIWWINESAGKDGQWLRQPLEKFLADDARDRQMPAWIPPHAKPLCIFPDHWFGSESYPFQSRKPSLIEPFLERKLSGAYPDRKEIRNFFSYRHLAKENDIRLYSVFLLEDKAYALYNALRHLNHPPRRITSPAFLWEERLQHVDADFNALGTLLIHHTGTECQLYFYHQGKYLFSRSVILGDTADGIDALVFEINQSLYMFSQKAKSELDKVYAVCDAPQYYARLSETLGREVMDISLLSGSRAEGGDIPGIEPLNDLLQWSRSHRNAAFFSIIERPMKQALVWWPVQMTGIVLGLVLLFVLVGENLFLHSLRNEENLELQAIEATTAGHARGIMLAQQVDAVAQVLDMAARTRCIDAVFRLPGAFPAPVQLKELDLDMASPKTVKLAAMVQARDHRELVMLLTRLVTQVKDAFENAQAFSLRDIDIRRDPSVRQGSADSYRIAFQLELP